MWGLGFRVTSLRLLGLSLQQRSLRTCLGSYSFCQRVLTDDVFYVVYDRFIRFSIGLKI